MSAIGTWPAARRPAALALAFVGLALAAWMAILAAVASTSQSGAGQAFALGGIAYFAAMLATWTIAAEDISSRSSRIAVRLALGLLALAAALLARQHVAPLALGVAAVATLTWLLVEAEPVPLVQRRRAAAVFMLSAAVVGLGVKVLLIEMEESSRPKRVSGAAAEIAARLDAEIRRPNRSNASSQQAALDHLVATASSQAELTQSSSAPARAEPAAPSAQTPAAIESKLSNRVLSATLRLKNRTQSAAATAVAIGHDGPLVYALTAAHAVEKGDRLSVERFTPTDRPRIAAVRDDVELVARWPEADLALLRFFDADQGSASLSIAPNAQQESAESFLALSAGCDDDAPHAASVRVLGTRLVRKYPRAAATLVWEVDQSSLPGRSGGPLVDAHGWLIGIASGTTGAKTYYCTAADIHQLLKQHGLRWLYEKAL